MVHNHSPDLHTSATTSNLLSLLLAPINSYQSALTLLALPNYPPLLSQQTYSTRRSIAHAITASILKNETYLETAEDVSGILELCHVLVRDQKDVGVGMGSTGPQRGRPSQLDYEELAEEQGWVARMVHLFRADSLEVQNDVSYRIFLIASVLTTNSSTIAATDGTTILQQWWRSDALYLSSTDNGYDQACSSLQTTRILGE
jgi:hypothetical protein